jgi:capsular exopolysaccharide synthesis family protein
MARIEDLNRQYQFQYQRAQETVQGRTADQEKVVKEAEQISQIEESLEARKLSLTAETYEQDFEVKALLARKATLEAQCEADRARLNAGRSDLELRMLEEGQKIQKLTDSASKLRSLQLSRKIYRENYETTQAALDTLTSPLNDILNESAQYERVEQAYLKMDEWVRDVKLALSQISVTVYDATEPTIPISPKWPLNIAMSGVLGIMVSFGIALLLEFGRKTVKTPDDATRSLGTPVLGVVPHFRRLEFGKKVLSLDVLKDSQIAETFNEIRFYIDAATKGRPPRSLLVTSAAAQEGKTTVATLLADALARSGKTVLLVDANVRLPYLHSVFHCDGKAGLADVLNNGTALRSCVLPTGVQNLSLMTAGSVGEDGLAWVQTARFVQFVRTACESFDHVIFDSTSTIGVADARIIACSVDAVICVVQAGRLNSSLVLRGVENLRQVQANILGVVVNNAWYTKGDHYYFRKRAIVSQNGNGVLRRQTDDKPSASDGKGTGKT